VYPVGQSSPTGRFNVTYTYGVVVVIPLTVSLYVKEFVSISSENRPNIAVFLHATSASLGSESTNVGRGTQQLETPTPVLGSEQSISLDAAQVNVKSDVTNNPDDGSVTFTVETDWFVSVLTCSTAAGVMYAT
jgi:hypothetical protein